MNTAQLQGLRTVHTATQTVLKRQPLSAKDMALQSHNLSKSGDMATMQDGSKYVWDKRFQHWAPWK